MKKKSILIQLCLIALIHGGCSLKTDNNTKTPPPPQSEKKSTPEILQTFEAPQAFSSYVRKMQFHNNQLFSLVFSKISPDAKFTSSLHVHSEQGTLVSVPQIPKEYTLIDFDLTKSGDIVQLAFKEVPSNTIFPFKELFIFINAKMAFTFLDENQKNSFYYDENGTPSMARHYDPAHTYFLTSNPLTQFARIRATDETILISAVGTFGFKLFAFDYLGHAISQTEIMPRSEFNSLVLDREAAFIDLMDTHGVISALTLSSKDSPIYNTHFGASLKWSGPEYQTLVQSFDMLSMSRKQRLTRASGDFFTSGIQSSQNEFVVFGSSGGPQNRKAFAAVFSIHLDPLYQSEFTISNESSLYAAVFHKEKLLVAGSTDSSQVDTGSVVKTADSFLSVISKNGTATLIHQFGTDRDDRITSLLSANNELFVAGNENGPITHTADQNPELGYQNWFIGRLK